MKIVFLIVGLITVTSCKSLNEIEKLPKGLYHISTNDLKKIDPSYQGKNKLKISAENKGLSLCHLHHWAFDVGWFTLLDGYTIKVSSAASNLSTDFAMMGNYEFIKVMTNSTLKNILANKEEIFPYLNAIKWHREIGRNLSAKEIENIQDLIASKVNWYDAIAEAIHESEFS